MSLWGKTDNLAGAPTFVARKATIDVTAVASNALNMVGSNTSFNTGDEVAYVVASGAGVTGLTTGTSYFIRRIDADKVEFYDTLANATNYDATTGRVAITAGTGVASLQRTGVANPAGVDAGSLRPYGEHNYNGGTLLLIDDTEAQQPDNIARGLNEPGWWVYRTYTDTNGSVRHKAEHLIFLNVAPATSGDALNDSTDAIVVDRTITITTAPVAASVTAPAEATFSVVAAVDPTTTLSYKWQTNGGAGTIYTDLADAGVYSGVTTATLTISDSTGLNGYKYRVVVSATGATSKTTTGVTLTVA